MPNVLLDVIPTDTTCVSLEVDQAYVLFCGVALFITVVLVLYLYYRDHKEVKATSPYLCILVIIGCYLLCMAAVLEVAFVVSYLLPSFKFFLLMVLD